MLCLNTAQVRVGALDAYSSTAAPFGKSFERGTKNKTQTRFGNGFPRDPTVMTTIIFARDDVSYTHLSDDDERFVVVFFRFSKMSHFRAVAAWTRGKRTNFPWLFLLNIDSHTSAGRVVFRYSWSFLAVGFTHRVETHTPAIWFGVNVVVVVVVVRDRTVAADDSRGTGHGVWASVKNRSSHPPRLLPRVGDRVRWESESAGSTDGRRGGGVKGERDRRGDDDDDDDRSRSLPPLAPPCARTHIVFSVREETARTSSVRGAPKGGTHRRSGVRPD